MAACSNNLDAKLAEVSEAIRDRDPSIEHTLREMFRNGAFRHGVDVAYAAIMLSRGETVEQICTYFESAYADILPQHGICEPVRPAQA